MANCIMRWRNLLTIGALDVLGVMAVGSFSIGCGGKVIDQPTIHGSWLSGFGRTAWIISFGCTTKLQGGLLKFFIVPTLHRPNLRAYYSLSLKRLRVFVPNRFSSIQSLLFCLPLLSNFFPPPHFFLSSLSSYFLRLAQQSLSLAAVSHLPPWSPLEGGVYGDNPG